MIKVKSKLSVLIQAQVFPYDILVIIGASEEEATDIIKKHTPDSAQAFLESERYAHKEGIKGFCCVCDPDRTIYLRVIAPLDTPVAFNTFNHETFHVAHEMYKQIGHQISPDRESYAYYIGWLTEEVYKLLIVKEDADAKGIS